jgi:hypothetical protein
MRAVWTMIAVAAIGLTAALAQAQPGGMMGGGVGMLVGNKSVHDELKLDKDQVDKLQKAFQEAQKNHSKDKPEERAANVSADVKKAAEDIMKADQYKRFKQISYQVEGPAAFTEEDVVKELKLTDDQKSAAKDSMNEMQKAMRDIKPDPAHIEEMMKKMKEIRETATDKVVSKLTDDQKKKWKEMTGEKFDLKLQPPGRP